MEPVPHPSVQVGQPLGVGPGREPRSRPDGAVVWRRLRHGRHERIALRSLARRVVPPGGLPTLEGPRDRQLGPGISRAPGTPAPGRARSAPARLGASMRAGDLHRVSVARRRGLSSGQGPCACLVFFLPTRPGRRDPSPCRLRVYARTQGVYPTHQAPSARPPSQLALIGSPIARRPPSIRRSES